MADGVIDKVGALAALRSKHLLWPRYRKAITLAEKASMDGRRARERYFRGLARKTIAKIDAETKP